MYRRWDKSKPPIGPWTLNRDCLQAQGLVAWYPLYGAGMDQVNNTLWVPDAVGRVCPSVGLPSTLVLGPWGEPALKGTTAGTYAEALSAPLLAMPLSMVAWAVYGTSVGNAQCLVSLCTDGADSRVQLQTNSLGLAQAVTVNSGGTQNQASATVGLTVGQAYHLCATYVSSTSRTIYQDGVIVGSDTTSNASSGWNRLLLGSRRNSGGVGLPWLGLQMDSGVYALALPPEHVAKLADRGSRFELYYPLRSPKWISAGTLLLPLVGVSCAQGATSGTGAIVVTHVLAGQAAAQANAGATGALVQSHQVSGAPNLQANATAVADLQQQHVLAGAPGAQANPASVAPLIQTHVLGGSACTQANTAAAAAIGQQHTLQSASSLQANAASTGTLNGGAVVLDGLPGAQANFASVGVLTQQHVLAGSAAVMASAAGAGSLVQQHILAGAACVQGNEASLGSVGGILIVLAGAPGAQASQSASGILVQSHLLAADPTVQANLASAQAVVQRHAIAASQCVQSNWSHAASLIEALPAAVELPDLRRLWLIEAPRRSWTITTER
jgi:Concanavalin A-like lectin/glucanases superfamily